MKQHHAQMKVTDAYKRSVYIRYTTESVNIFDLISVVYPLIYFTKDYLYTFLRKNIEAGNSLQIKNILKLSRLG